MIQTGNFVEAVAECEVVLEDSDSIRVGKAFYSRGVAHRGWAHKERAMEKAREGECDTRMSLQLLKQANLVSFLGRLS